MDETKKVSMEAIEESQNLAKEGCYSYDVLDEGYKFSGTTIGIALGVVLIAVGGGIVEGVRWIKKKVKAAKEKKAEVAEEPEEAKEPGE